LKNSWKKKEYLEDSQLNLKQASMEYEQKFYTQRINENLERIKRAARPAKQETAGKKTKKKFNFGARDILNEVEKENFYRNSNAQPTVSYFAQKDNLRRS